MVRMVTGNGKHGLRVSHGCNEWYELLKGIVRMIPRNGKNDYKKR